MGKMQGTAIEILKHLTEEMQHKIKNIKQYLLLFHWLNLDTDTMEALWCEHTNHNKPDQLHIMQMGSPPEEDLKFAKNPRAEYLHVFQ